MFGEFVRSIRKQKRVGLREFCLKTRKDASNWSKVERGVLPPPQDSEALEELAQVLELEKGSAEWTKLFDLAAIDRGKIPADIMSEEELLSSLPTFFRTLRGQKPTKEELHGIAELIKRS
jgi:transcriptional regulator with XRE-family HTH domain